MFALCRTEGGQDWVLATVKAWSRGRTGGRLVENLIGQPCMDLPLSENLDTLAKARSWISR